jgi:hypothetical protein
VAIIVPVMGTVALPRPKPVLKKAASRKLFRILFPLHLPFAFLQFQFGNADEIPHGIGFFGRGSTTCGVAQKNVPRGTFLGLRLGG